MVSRISENELFKHVSDGNVSEIKALINDLKASVNCYDDQGMTPLQHAAFKGKYEICKLLLDCGADVNANEHMYGYSALCLAALANHCDVVMLLLEHGANPAAINSNKRTASQMAAFVGNHKAVCIINSYVSRDIIDYFTERHGLEQEPRLPLFLSGPVHRLVIMPNIHPNLIKVIDVLNILAEKQLKEMSNEKLSLKLHHIACVLKSCAHYLDTEGKKLEEKNNVLSEQKILSALIKLWLKDCENSIISLILEKFLRRNISEYPFRDCILHQHIITTIKHTELGNEPNALTILSNAIIGEQSYHDSDCCATCGEPSASKRCSACKNVQYCDRTCQKLHWPIHKNICKTHETILSNINELCSSKTNSFVDKDQPET